MTEPITSKPSISLISTATVDIFMDKQETVLASAEGGPALFLGRALAEERVPYDTCNGELLKVEILVTADGEFGRIPVVPAPMPIKQEVLSDWTIVSTVLEEWQFVSDVDLPAHLFVDLQGFVRDGQNFGGKKQWDISPKLAGQIFCMKGTAEEVRYLPPAVLADQKRRLLLITHGKDGVELFAKGKRQHFAAEQIPGLKHTVGAGDTLFGHFIAGLYKGATPEAALKQALRRVARFLKRKLETEDIV